MLVNLADCNNGLTPAGVPCTGTESLQNLIGLTNLSCSKAGRNEHGMPCIPPNDHCVAGFTPWGGWCSNMLLQLEDADCNDGLTPDGLPCSGTSTSGLQNLDFGEKTLNHMKLMAKHGGFDLLKKVQKEYNMKEAAKKMFKMKKMQVMLI